MGIWGRPKSSKDRGIYIKARLEVLLAWREFVNWLCMELKKNVSYEEALITLLRNHPKGFEILKKYKIIKDDNVLW